MTQPPLAQKRRCLVVYDHLPHYRFGVFSEMECGEGWAFTFAAGASSQDGSILTIPLSRLRSVRSLKNVRVGPLLWQTGLLRLLWGPYDAVIFLGNAANLSTWLAAALSRVLHRPTFFWTIGWHRPDAGLRRIVRLSFYSLANALMLYGEDGEAIGRAMGYPARKMHVIGNSNLSSSVSDDSGLAAVALGRVLPPVGSNCVGAVARITPEKRFDYLVDAVALLRGRGHDISVLLTGDGPASADLIIRAKRAGVPLYLTGGLHGVEVLNEVYRHLIVTVLPERAGLTVMQSMEHGVPVVTVDAPFRQVPEFRAVVPGRTGVLYTADDIESLASAIETTIRLVKERPEEVGRACRQEIKEHWSARVHAERIIDVLDGCPDKNCVAS